MIDLKNPIQGDCFGLIPKEFCSPDQESMWVVVLAERDEIILRRASAIAIETQIYNLEEIARKNG